MPHSIGLLRTNATWLVVCFLASRCSRSSFCKGFRQLTKLCFYHNSALMDVKRSRVCILIYGMYAEWTLIFIAEAVMSVTEFNSQIASAHFQSFAFLSLPQGRLISILLTAGRCWVLLFSMPLVLTSLPTWRTRCSFLLECLPLVLRGTVPCFVIDQGKEVSNEPVFCSSCPDSSHTPLKCSWNY